MLYTGDIISSPKVMRGSKTTISITIIPSIEYFFKVLKARSWYSL